MIPVIAAGELLRVLHEKVNNTEYQKLIGELINLPIVNLETDELKHFGNLAIKVRQKDNRVGVMDVLLVAFSLASRKCSCLLTFDRTLLESKGINELIKGDGRKFRITSEPN